MLEKTMLIKMNQQAYGTTMFQILTEDQIEQIYFAALDVLEISGLFWAFSAIYGDFWAVGTMLENRAGISSAESISQKSANVL